MPFISKTLRYSFCACVRNILKIVTFVTGVFQFVFGCFPPLDPILMPFGQIRCRYTNIKTYVNGVLGLGGGGGGGGEGVV